MLACFNPWAALAWYLTASQSTSLLTICSPINTLSTSFGLATKPCAFPSLTSAASLSPSLGLLTGESDRPGGADNDADCKSYLPPSSSSPPPSSSPRSLLSVYSRISLNDSTPRSCLFSSITTNRCTRDLRIVSKIVSSRSFTVHV